MAEFKPKIRESGSAANIRTGITPGVTVSDGDFYVNAASGHLSVEAGGVQVPIASDIIVTCAVNVNTDVTATTAPIHRLAIITDGISSTPGDGLVRSVNGRTPNASGDITTLTYSDVGAAAVTHTHTKAEITDLLTEFEKIGRVCTGTLSHINSAWTISVTTVNGIEKSSSYTDVALAPTNNTNLTPNTVVWVDIDPDSYTNSLDYQTYLNEWQYIYKIAYQGTSQIRVYSSRIPTIDIPLVATILY